MDIFEYNSVILSTERHFIHKLADDYLSNLNFVARERNIEWFFNNQENCSYAVLDELDKMQQLPNQKKREIIIVIGLNSIKEIEEIYATMHPKSYLIVHEPEAGFLQHVLLNKDLKVFGMPNVTLIACPVKDLMFHLNKIFNTSLILLLGNIKIYITSYYRQFAKQITKDVIEIISLTVTSNRWGAGNSIDDCLEGSTQVLQNIKHMFNSRDVRKLKNIFKNMPLIIVSAGPSLDKNIHLLYQVQNRAIVIATESILSRLHNEGIVPHFVTTMERVQQAYDFSYKGKVIPPEVTLIAPPVIKPIIFDEYKGNYIIPLREGVKEFFWWDNLLELGQDSFVMVGDSTAHLAFGFAIHVGANPIILVGQDLAFGELGTKCHASGTIYEQIGTNYLKDPMQEPNRQTEGYYGGLVTTNQLWLNFKKWFEIYIEHYKDIITVINATEGGARIRGALQAPLREVIERYCQEEVPVLQYINNCPKYDLNAERIAEKLKKAAKELEDIAKLAEKLGNNLDKVYLRPDINEQELLQIHQTLKKSDELWQRVQQHDLLFHNVQPMIVHTFYRLYRLEEVLNYENILENVRIQKDFIEVVIFVVNQLLFYMRKSIEDLKELKGCFV